MEEVEEEGESPEIWEFKVISIGIRKVGRSEFWWSLR